MKCKIVRRVASETRPIKLPIKRNRHPNTETLRQLKELHSLTEAKPRNKKAELADKCGG